MPSCPAPYGIYPTRSGYLAIAMASVSALGRLLGLEELEAYEEPSSWWSERDEVERILAARFETDGALLKSEAGAPRRRERQGSRRGLDRARALTAGTGRPARCRTSRISRSRASCSYSLLVIDAPHPPGGQSGSLAPSRRHGTRQGIVAPRRAVSRPLPSELLARRVPAR